MLRSFGATVLTLIIFRRFCVYLNLRAVVMTSKLFWWTLSLSPLGQVLSWNEGRFEYLYVVKHMTQYIEWCQFPWAHFALLYDISTVIQICCKVYNMIWVLTKHIEFTLVVSKYIKLPFCMIQWSAVQVTLLRIPWPTWSFKKLYIDRSFL